MFDTLAFAFKAFTSLQNVTVHGLDNFITNIKNSSAITIANHQSYIDDPIIWTPLHNELPNDKFRYTIAARENFESMKWPSVDDMRLLLVNRRNTNNDKTNTGLNQDCFYRANKILGQNGWIHIFPEGRIIQECGSLVGTFKPGVSHLLMTCDDDLRIKINEQLGAELYEYSGIMPTLIPVAHFGMHNVLPIHQSPFINQTIHIFYGEPINVKELLEELKTLPLSDQRTIFTNLYNQREQFDKI